jgi:uncharacterized coiled-coil DUF342 family protein
MQSEVRHVSQELDSLRTEFQGLRNDTAQQLGSIRAEFRQFRSEISEQVQSLRNEFQGYATSFSTCGKTRRSSSRACGLTSRYSGPM